jgi:hypothetical protein
MTRHELFADRPIVLEGGVRGPVRAVYGKAAATWRTLLERVPVPKCPAAQPGERFVVVHHPVERRIGPADDRLRRLKVADRYSARAEDDVTINGFQPLSCLGRVAFCDERLTVPQQPRTGGAPRQFRGFRSQLRRCSQAHQVELEPCAAQTLCDRVDGARPGMDVVGILGRDVGDAPRLEATHRANRGLHLPESHGKLP